MVSAPARRELVRHMMGCGLSERRSLRIIGMSASAYRYEPAADQNGALKDKIIALAQRAGQKTANPCHASAHGQLRWLIQRCLKSLRD